MNEQISTSRDGEVQELLWDARSEWYNLGIALDVDKNTLKSIEKTYRSNCDDCFNAMLKSCSETNTSITWSGLYEALRKPTVARNDVAQKIKAKRKKSIRLNSYGSSVESASDSEDTFEKPGIIIIGSTQQELAIC